MFLTSANPRDMIDGLQVQYLVLRKTPDGQGAYATVSANEAIRGQPGPQSVLAVPAGAAEGTTYTASLPLPENVVLPEMVSLILVNQSDASASWAVTQTVNDFLSTSSNATPLQVPLMSSGAAFLTNGEAQNLLIQYPYTVDGPITVTFTLTTGSTNGGNIGAQIRWE
jgi:hypothetical protein